MSHSRPKPAQSNSLKAEPGSGGWIRTNDQRINSPLRYRCATPDQRWSGRIATEPDGVKPPSRSPPCRQGHDSPGTGACCRNAAAQRRPRARNSGAGRAMSGARKPSVRRTRRRLRPSNAAATRPPRRDQPRGRAGHVWGAKAKRPEDAPAIEAIKSGRNAAAAPRLKVQPGTPCLRRDSQAAGGGAGA